MASRAIKSGMALQKAGRGPGSLVEDASDGAFAICLDLEVEVFHDWGGVICGGRAVEGVLVDDGNAASVFVGSVSVRYLVAIRGSSGDVQHGGGVQPGYRDEDGIRGVG